MILQMKISLNWKMPFVKPLFKISKGLNLYRQNYCGCEFSIRKI